MKSKTISITYLGARCQSRTSFGRAMGRESFSKARPLRRSLARSAETSVEGGFIPKQSM